MKKLNLTLVLVLVLTLAVQTFAGDFRLTNKRFALGAMSLVALNETLQTKDELTVHVIGNQYVAEELVIYKDQKVGAATLTKITSSTDLPVNKPDVILVTEGADVREVVKYCQDNGVFSIANNTEACRQGISTAVAAKLPLILEHPYSISSVYAKINTSSLFAEGMKLNKQVKSVSKEVEKSGYDEELAVIQLY